MALSAQQQLFIEEYLRTFNATASYLKAYPNVKRTTAASNGYRLLRENPEVDEMIQQRLSETAMSANEVLMRLAEQARGDIGEYIVKDDGNLTIDIESAKEAKRTHLIKKLTQRRFVRTTDDYRDEETTITIEMYDAQAALVQLGKHHKLFVDRQEVTGKDGGPIEHDYRGELLRKLADLSKPGRTIFGETGGESTTNGTSADPELAGTD